MYALRVSQHLTSFIRALSSSSRTGVLYKRNVIKTERLLSSQSNVAAVEKIKYTWLRAAEPHEADMDAWNRNQTRYGGSCISLNSKHPISEDMWKNTFKHIHMQTVMLRLDMILHGNKKWLCEVNRDPDVKLLDNQIASKVLDELFENGINESPLKVRIVVAKPDDFCLFPSIREHFPYQYTFIYFFNHAIGDGQSVAMIYLRIWQLLDDMLSGRNYMERLPFGTYTNGEVLREVKGNMKIKLSNDPDTLQKEKEILESTIKTPLLNEVFNVDENTKVGTKYSHYMLEKNIHHLFLEKCKSFGVRFSSGIVAAINTAIVEMVKNAGLQKECYHLSVMQNVDMRRYLKKEPMTAMGFFGGKIHQSYHLDSNIKEKFWDHSKEINSRTSNLLKNGGPILQDAVRQLTLDPYDPNIKRGAAQMEWDYTFNNVLAIMGQPDDQLSIKNPIQVTDMEPINMTQNFAPCQIMLHSFHGIVRLSIWYTTNCITKDMADELMERVLNVIRDMALS